MVGNAAQQQLPRASAGALSFSDIDDRRGGLARPEDVFATRTAGPGAAHEALEDRLALSTRLVFAIVGAEAVQATVFQHIDREEPRSEGSDRSDQKRRRDVGGWQGIYRPRGSRHEMATTGVS